MKQSSIYQPIKPLLKMPVIHSNFLNVSSFVNQQAELRTVTSSAVITRLKNTELRRSQSTNRPQQIFQFQRSSSYKQQIYKQIGVHLEYINQIESKITTTPVQLQTDPKSQKVQKQYKILEAISTRMATLRLGQKTDKSVEKVKKEPQKRKIDFKLQHQIAKINCMADRRKALWEFVPAEMDLI